jgi:iron complex transport system permease protein
MRSLKARVIVTYAGLGSLALLACLLAPLVGSTQISLARAFDRSMPFADNTDAQIFFIARLPRTLAAAIAGSSLAAAGAVFQALLRNPLADPFTLGISAGAALGAVLALSFGVSVGLFGLPPVLVSSFAGAGAAVAVVFGLARLRQRGLSTHVLLLAGVTLNAFFSAIILFVQYFADFTQTLRAVRWLMGDLDVSGYRPILAAVPFWVPALACFATLPRALNLLSLGPEAAAARGVDVARAQRVAFFGASVASGAAVSLGGPIGFVGIIVPHAVRLGLGADYRLVLPASALGGAAFLIGCDVVARTALAPLQIPIGVITAMLGGPFFLWLLLRKS